MQVDEHVIALRLLLLAVVAALEDEVALVLDLEVPPRVGNALHEEGFGAEVAGLVEVAGGADDDFCDLVQARRQYVHRLTY